MYHLVLAVPPEDDHLEDKLDAVGSLPEAAESVRVTVVHVHDGDVDVEAVPAVARAPSTVAFTTTALLDSSVVTRSQGLGACRRSSNTTGKYLRSRAIFELHAALDSIGYF